MSWNTMFPHSCRKTFEFLLKIAARVPPGFSDKEQKMQNKTSQTGRRAKTLALITHANLLDPADPSAEESAQTHAEQPSFV